MEEEPLDETHGDSLGRWREEEEQAEEKAGSSGQLGRGDPEHIRSRSTLIVSQGHQDRWLRILCLAHVPSDRGHF